MQRSLIKRLNSDYTDYFSVGRHLCNLPEICVIRGLWSKISIFQRPLLAIVALIFFASPACAGESSSPPPGMRIEKIGDLEIMVPRDAKVERTKKGGLISVEKTEEYVSRKLLEAEERFEKIEKEQEELRKEVKGLKDIVEGMRKK